MGYFQRNMGYFWDALGVVFTKRQGGTLPRYLQGSEERAAQCLVKSGRF